MIITVIVIMVAVGNVLIFVVIIVTKTVVNAIPLDVAGVPHCGTGVQP